MRIGQHFGVNGAGRLPVLLAVLALLVQALTPAAAMAAQGRGQTVVLCTLDGMRTVAVDEHGQPIKGKPGFAGMPCADCLAAATAAILAPEISVAPASYAVALAPHAAERRQDPPRARGPPRPYGQGPPTA